MGELVLTDCKLWLDAYDLSGQMNALALEYSADVHDSTTFASAGFHEKTGSLKTWSAAHAGFFEAGVLEIDDVLFSKMGLVNQLMTVGPTTGAEGEDSYFGLSTESEYSPGAQVGDLFTFDVSAVSNGDLIRGTIMYNATIGASGNGTARQLGAVGATEKLHMGMHVIAASGGSPTLDVTVESDDNSGMTSSTMRGTFAQAIAIGSEWLDPVDGAITDDWWRIDFVIGGAGPSFTFVVSIGIQ